MIWLVMMAAAAPPGFVHRGDAHGCALFLGPAEPDGVIPMRAECRWPERTLADLASVLDDPLAQRSLARVTGVEVLERHPDRVVVWQQHEVALLPDREVVVDWVAADEGGGRTWRWRSQPRDDLPRRPGNVACARWEGAWDVRPLASGGVSVVLDNRYHPGDYPPWLVRPFLTSQLAEAVASLRASASP